MNKYKLPLLTGLLFIILDVLFWAFVIGSCMASPIDCADTQTFGPFFWFLPFTYWLSTGAITIPSGIANSLVQTNLFIALFGGAMHFLFGFFLGLPFRFKRSN